MALLYIRSTPLSVLHCFVRLESLVGVSISRELELLKMITTCSDHKDLMDVGGVVFLQRILITDYRVLPS